MKDNTITLFNAGKAAIFIYHIIGGCLSDDEVARINSIGGNDKILKRLEAIADAGCELKFDHIDNQIFNHNLVMLDGEMPRLLSCLLMQRFMSNETHFSKLINELNKDNPLNYNSVKTHPYYEYKLKHFLISVARGMMLDSVWNGSFDDNGGYSVIKEDGEILSFNIYDRNKFEDYLINNAYIESDTKSNHNYGIIEKNENAELVFKLNLQLRLK